MSTLAVLAGGRALGADSVEVVEELGEPTWYSVRTALPNVEADFPTLRDERLGPDAMVTIGTTVRDVSHVLCHGPVHGQRVLLANGGTGSVEIKGGDESLLMDRDVVTKVWSDGGASDAIAAVLHRYGWTEHVDALDVRFAANDRALVQHDSDLRFVRRLARRYGCWFWLRRDPRATATDAYFKRPPKPPDRPAATIRINAPSASVDSLDIEWDVARPTTAVANQLGPRDKEPIDGGAARSPAPPLAARALADVARPRTVRITAPADTAGDLRARSEAALIEAGWFIRARGTTTATRLGAVLRAHDHVALHGAGLRHSGTYVVARVRHVDDGTDHRMDFELVRNAWEN